MTKALSRTTSRSKALTPAQKERENALAHVVQEVADNDTRICRAADLAPELKVAIRQMREDGIDLNQLLAGPQGVFAETMKRYGLPKMTKVDVEVALDATLNGKEAPVYLKYAHERHVMRHRGHEGGGGGEPATPMFVLPVAVPVSREQLERMPVIDADEVK